MRSGKYDGSLRGYFFPRVAANLTAFRGARTTGRSPVTARRSKPIRQAALGASPTESRRYVVGVISDTHGLIRAEAVERLCGSDLIVHCGDIGAPAVLDALRAVAPVRAVRGNNDKGSWAVELPTDDAIEVGSYILYVIHDLGELSLEPAAAGFTAVLSGHSHRPLVEERKGVLFVNPGSAGPRRFSLPVTVAQLALGSGRCDAHIIELAA